MISKKCFLKNKQDIEEAAIYTVENIKLDNIENEFFSERDLIELTEKALKKETKKIKRCPCGSLFKILNAFKGNEKIDLVKYYEECVRKELFRTLRRNVVINELYRLYDLYQKNKLVFTLKDIDYILESKILVSYLFVNNHISFEFFEEVVNTINRQETKDFTTYGKGKIKKIKREIEDIMYQEQK